MNHHKNIQKALLSAIMIAILSLATYGFSLQTLRHTVLPNIVLTLIIIFSACFIIDTLYELTEKRKLRNGRKKDIS